MIEPSEKPSVKLNNIQSDRSSNQPGYVKDQKVKPNSKFIVEPYDSISRQEVSSNSDKSDESSRVAKNSALNTESFNFILNINEKLDMLSEKFTEFFEKEMISRKPEPVNHSDVTSLYHK